TTLQAGLQRAQTDLLAYEVAIAARQGECNALQNSQRALHQKMDTVVYEIQNLGAQEEVGLQQRARLAAQAVELENRGSELQQQLNEFSARLESLRQQRDAANTSLTENRVALAAEEQLADSFRKQKQSLEPRI